MKTENVDMYIAGFPADVQVVLEKIRTIILEEAPNSVEKISYQMPTYWRGKNIVHFAAFKEHIGLYPTPSGISSFEEELKPYKHAKGSIQFPLTEPIPYDLIRKIVKSRVEEVNQSIKD